MSAFSKNYYDPNHPGFPSRFGPVQKLRAIAKMKPGAVPPQEYLTMKIGGDIYTVEACEADLKEFSKGPDVIGLEYSRPMHQLVKTG
jgi:hypothetical protein